MSLLNVVFPTSLGSWNHCWVLNFDKSPLFSFFMSHLKYRKGSGNFYWEIQSSKVVILLTDFNPLSRLQLRPVPIYWWKTNAETDPIDLKQSCLNSSAGGVDNYSRWSYYARHEWLLQVNIQRNNSDPYWVDW